MIMKKFKSGFVVGKFLPLHLGHEYVIETALEQCDHVFVLSYTSKFFHGVTAKTRESWLTTRFPKDEYNITILVLEDGFPADDESEIVHREFCSKIILDNIPNIDAIFGSEDYIEPFADFVEDYITADISRLRSPNITPVVVDINREKFPVSGTDCRFDISTGYHATVLERMFGNKTPSQMFMNKHVQSTFTPKVIILGGESSGKTTLAKALAKKLKTTWVPEYGRQVFDERGGVLTHEDFDLIGNKQAQFEKVAASVANKVIVCDTNAITTYFYSIEMTGSATQRTVENMLTCVNPWDQVYLCDPNINFFQDGTRKNSIFRNKGHEFYRTFLRDRRINYKLVSGSVSERVKFIENDLRSEGKI